MCLQVYSGTAWYSMLWYSMLWYTGPCLSREERCCVWAGLGWARLPGTRASSSSVLGGGSPGGHWPHTGTTTHYRGTVTSHPAVSSSRGSVREAAVTRDIAAEEQDI